MPTLAERLETATTTLEGLVANTTGTGDMVLKDEAEISPLTVTLAVSPTGRRVVVTKSSISAFSSAGAQTLLLDFQGGEINCKILSVNGNYIGFGGSFSTSGAYAATLTLTGTTNVTLPTSGMLATTAEGTSTTPGLNRQWLRSGTIQLANLTEVKSGTSSSTSATPVSFNLVSGTTSTTGFGGRRAAPSNNGVFFEGKSAGVIPWAAQTIEGEVLLLFTSSWDTGSVFRLHVGRTNAQSTGDTAHASHPNSFEIRYEPSTALKVIGATASATTSVTSSFTPTLGTAFRLRWKASGGTILVWVNGTLVATNAGGPTADSGVTANVFYMGVENSGTVTTGSEAKTSIPVLDIY
jgi:hypothetical protein